MDLTNCKKGRHNLIDIQVIVEDHLSERVVRWCKTCGAVVVDIDCDGRINPGRIVPMQIPEIFKEHR